MYSNYFKKDFSMLFVSTVISLSIIIILIALIILPKEKFSYNENKYLRQFPVFRLNNLIDGKYMSDIDDYVSDNFPYRDLFLNIKNKFLKFSGMYYQNGVYYGKDGALYEEYDEPKNSDLIISKINNFSKAVDANMNFILAPSSVEIYSDNISKYNVNVSQIEVIDYFKQNLDIDLINVYDKLSEHKDEYIYFKTDHHWTSRGAYYAYQEYCKTNDISPFYYNFETISNDFYGTLYSKVIDNNLDKDYIEKIIYAGNYEIFYFDDNVRDNKLYNDDYLNKKDKYSYFLNNNHSLIEISNNSLSNKSNILIVKDSYANNFVPLIVNNYAKTYVIDLRYYNGSVSEFVYKNNIENILLLYNINTIDDDIGILKLK